MSGWKFILLLAAAGAMFLPACQAAAPLPPVRVALTVAPPPTEPTPFVCTSWPQGMSLQVIRQPSRRVQIEVEGLRPGEFITLRIVGKKANGETTMEFMAGDPIGDDGTFSTVESLPGEPAKIVGPYQIQVIHERGVACTTI